MDERKIASINANRKPAERLKLIEIHREDIESLPALMDLVRSQVKEKTGVDLELEITLW